MLILLNLHYVLYKKFKIYFLQFEGLGWTHVYNSSLQLASSCRGNKWRLSFCSYLSCAGKTTTETGACETSPAHSRPHFTPHFASVSGDWSRLVTVRPKRDGKEFFLDSTQFHVLWDKAQTTPQLYSAQSRFTYFPLLFAILERCFSICSVDGVALRVTPFPYKSERSLKPVLRWNAM
jgi:hypothetical protein